jgi:hypothetical protein
VGGDFQGVEVLRELEGGVGGGVGERSLRPRTARMMRVRQARRRGFLGSLKRRMPRMAVPVAPRPVQTASAVPMGMPL